MKPTDFNESNTVLNKPDGMTDEECGALPVFRDGKQCISCWELSDDDLININQNRKVYLGILSGATQPPVYLTTESPFEP